jgi:hypothetical protein
MKGEKNAHPAQGLRIGDADRARLETVGFYVLAGEEKGREDKGRGGPGRTQRNATQRAVSASETAARRELGRAWTWTWTLAWVWCA